jgi:hypothetical protein
MEPKLNLNAEPSRGKWVFILQYVDPNGIE